MQDISQWQIWNCYAYLLTNGSIELMEVAHMIISIFISCSFIKTTGHHLIELW